MIVADTNLLIHLLVDGPNTETAMDVRQKDPDWRAPSYGVPNSEMLLGT